MNHIVIIGFMGSGKTKVGKRLAKDFNLPFIDVDRVVSKKMNLTMKEIFERFGEPFYRALETTVIKALIDDPEQKVISLGAGLPMQEQNAKYIKKLGTVVYLKGSYATLKKRLENSSNNPLIEGEDKEDKIKKLLKQRDPVYAKYAEDELEGLCHLGRMLLAAAPCLGAVRLEDSAREMLDALEDPGCEARALAVETCAADLEEVLQALRGAAVK